MMNTRLVPVTVTATIALLAACKGGDGGGGGGNATVPGVAHLLHGPSAPVSFAPAGSAFAVPSDGTWYVTPDQARVHLERINFEGQAGTASTSADLVDCVLTFDKTTPSLSSLLDCPFSIAPGSYVGMTVHVNGTFEVLISDAANGIYTDPAAPASLVNAAPAGGADFVSYTRPLGGAGVEQLFAAPLVVGSGDTISLSIVLDAIQTLRVTVTGGGSALEFTDLDQIPVNIFPTLGAPGVARYFTTADTADSYNDSLVLANILRLFLAAGSNAQPTYAMPVQTAGAINGCSTPGAAYPVDPANATPNTAGARLGGWLGTDGSGTTCWALAGDPTFSTYKSYMTFTAVTVVGSSGVLSCETTTTPTPPTSGSTYASGCPPITPSATANLKLVAD